VDSNAPSLLTWQRVTKLPSKGAAATASTLSATGQVVMLAPLAGFPGTPAYVWRSTNGLTYKTSKIPNGEVPAYLLRAGADLVAIDHSQGPNGETLWRSSDGVTWKAQKGGLPGNRVVNGAGSSAGGVIVAGMSDNAPRTWISQDGKTWVQGDLPFTGSAYDASPNYAAVSPSGAWVAGTYGRGSSAGALLWASSDGATWQAVPLPVDKADYPLITSLSATPTGLLMVLAEYQSGGVTSTLWTSSDGLTWQQVHEVAGEVGFVSSAAATASGTAPGVVAFTADGMLVSPDGATWTEQPLPPLDKGAYVLTSVVMADGTVVVSSAKPNPDDPFSRLPGSLYVGTLAP
jgi:hypothetical protein